VGYLKKLKKDELIHPVLIKVMDRTHEKLQKAGTPFKTYSGLRTFEEQNALYKKGRDPFSLKVVNKKDIVTKAKGGQSMHNYACATDQAPKNLQTEQDWDVHWPKLNVHDGIEDEIWYELEKAMHESLHELEGQLSGESCEWGGRWNFVDAPHIQIKTSLRELRAGRYPRCDDVNWLIKAHTSFLFGTPWMNRRVQYLLTMQSYSVGPVDGIIGQDSKNAIVVFQQTNNMDETGTVDKPVVEKLVRLHQQARSQRPDEYDDLCTHP